MAVVGARCDALNVDTSHKDHTFRSSSSTGVCEINARTKIEPRFVFESPLSLACRVESHALTPSRKIRFASHCAQLIVPSSTLKMWGYGVRNIFVAQLGSGVYLANTGIVQHGRQDVPTSRSKTLE